MNVSERNMLVEFLMEYKALEKFKECVEKYGTVKNFYVFCDGVPVELAFRSAFGWNMCEDETINGMPGEKFWEHLNSQWSGRLYKKKVVACVSNPEKVRVMAQLFRMYHCPNSAKKFGGKIGATEDEVKRAMVLAQSKMKLFEGMDLSSDEDIDDDEEIDTDSDVVDEEPQERKKSEDVAAVGYDWANLTGVGNGRRLNGSRGGYPDGLMFRVKRGGKSSYPILFSKYISDYLRERGCDESMEMCQNRMTNQLVFVFGKGKAYQVSKYLSDGSLKVQNMAIIDMVESYVKTKFVEDKNYYIPVLKMVHSKELRQVAMVVTNSCKTEV